MKSLSLLVIFAALSVSNEAAVIQETSDTYEEIVIRETDITRKDIMVIDNGIINFNDKAISDSDITWEVGTINPGDRFMTRWAVKMDPTPSPQSQLMTYKALTPITYVGAGEVGPSQFAIGTLVEGGPGYDYATIRIRSVMGHGFHYMMEVWGLPLNETLK